VEPAPAVLGNGEHQLVPDLFDPDQVFLLQLPAQVGVNPQGQGNVHHALEVALDQPSPPVEDPQKFSPNLAGFKPAITDSHFYPLIVKLRRDFRFPTYCATPGAAGSRVALTGRLKTLRAVPGPRSGCYNALGRGEQFRPIRPVSPGPGPAALFVNREFSQNPESSP